MNRRSFMGAILAAGAAPWVAKARVLMPVRCLVVPERTLYVPETLHPGDLVVEDRPGRFRLANGCESGRLVGVYDGHGVIFNGIGVVQAASMLPNTWAIVTKDSWHERVTKAIACHAPSVNPSSLPASSPESPAG